MPLAPELGKLPEIVGSFYRAGLIKELIDGMLRGETGRDIVSDAKRLLRELESENQVNLMGLENMPRNVGCLIVFNHPNMDTLLPAMLKLIVGINENSGQQMKLAMGSEIPMTTENYVGKRAVPGSVSLLKRFHQMYSNNIISVPNTEDRKDFVSGRTVAVRKIMRAFKENSIVVISPEGHVEDEGVISRVDTYHDGSGKLAVLATKVGISTVPVAIWEEDDKEIEVRVGQPFLISTFESNLAAIEAMSKIAQIMPEKLRGPFK
ncbi:hypothetical protein A3K29_01315 [Candidatus Collierbacteria bacterium RIFOXYB2_FULL_46_14]|uniref:Phospholipid/glycerol acyltransferase domain-containing protein n=1 Tax=Candidatus Collierbacteria bacterium GW2011_GWA2_46_26 TaxID=1618381 RepID=A0A0G1SHJ8_9BACT|nr:MAG: hypothetical protein UW29_C0006G0003 [Candidatus Collierbacteria bacterium GW2011_GWC2_44_13]KKU32790.1 MAG: hypothetical protein UX47_C0007G0034 [Candidatus Collierbacteria bacterium GW2011_GWA2_46_26]OGD72770.1 MAG: hypothetical protein A3K29_01315 [Candidatus Collierbacteria bacterium RIFOXYB2_FULL_46_14]OGD75812.1 MAG: hypothetical protein A3K43_01315 [Candidatus Collierbacteria bacterium RIFOXYA2_FULL_46_20]OGD77148.1 MAG: hypothetical protein A3K39_01315 [Candidatus Collierbacteri